MSSNLIDFCNKIEGFDELKPAQKLEYIAYSVSLNGNGTFNHKEIEGGFAELRQVPYSNISQYLRFNTGKEAKKRKKRIKFLQEGGNYQFEGTYEKELKETIKKDEQQFLHFKIETTDLKWKPSDIPFSNNKIRKNAHFFTKLYFLFYHLENSIRNFLNQRLTKIKGSNWEQDVLSSVDLQKAVSIRNEVSISDMLPDRGNNILFYCMWDDYAKIIIEFPEVFRKKEEKNEIIAHLHTLTKIRNAIAHNAVTIPKEYLDEVTLFLNKFIKIMKRNES